MSKSKPPRKAYRPKPRVANSVAMAIESASLLQRSAVQHVIDDCRLAFDRLKRQIDPDSACRTLATALNISEQLTALGIASDAESRQAITAALDTIASLYDRGQWTMHAADIKAIDEGMVRHFAQLRVCSRREYDTALQTANRVCYQARLGNHSPRARLLRNAEAQIA